MNKYKKLAAASAQIPKLNYTQIFKHQISLVIILINNILYIGEKTTSKSIRCGSSGI